MMGLRLLLPIGALLIAGCGGDVKMMSAVGALMLAVALRVSASR